MSRLMPVNSSVQVQRRTFFHIVQTDGITPALGEAGGQPQISTDGAAWTNTGIGVLVSIGHGGYYADLTQAAIAAPCNIKTRYASGSTAEIPGELIQVGVNPYDTAQFGLTVWPANMADLNVDASTGGVVLAAAGLNHIPVTDPGPVADMTTLSSMVVALWRRAYRMTSLTTSTITTYKDDQTTVNTTQPVSDNGVIQVQGNAT